MRVHDDERTLVRIFIRDSDKWHRAPLDRALIERLKKEGFAGVTVTHGVAGFGAKSVIHTAHLLDLSGDLPVVIEVVDDEEHVQKLLSILDEMVKGGALVTIQTVRAIKFAPVK